MKPSLSSKNTFRPRLIHLPRGRSGEKKQAYLQLEPNAPPARIGPVDSPHYKLVQVLFSPANLSQTRFHPVQQSMERVYQHALGTSLEHAYVSTRMRDGMRAAVARLVSGIKKTEAGKHLSFIQTDRYMMMSIGS
jgi:hypothetical protein